MEFSESTDINLDLGDGSPARSSLERIRQRLADTSAKNSLISTPFEHEQVVRLTGELPEQVYESLTDRKPLEMAPIPAPSRQELRDEGYLCADEDTGEHVRSSYPTPSAWARRHGINTNHELPEGSSAVIDLGHADDKLQTLLFPDELDTRLNKLRQLAQRSMEESGTNILYLSLGYLEWYESPSSQTPRLSPLFIVPVELTRSRRVSADGSHTYQIKLRDDGLLNNASLSQRLLWDFDLSLPVVDDDSQPESYFSDVRRIVEPVDSRWKVRRYASLCLLDFTRQLMHEDLDPSAWPADAKLSDHPLLQKIFADDNTAQTTESATTAAEHLIDSLPGIHTEFPLIHDADSDQHSALIDVLNGRNLVIEGAPGTGKSQTITNLIGACINKGLSVLFVAEKLTALEVVKQRLDQADLGDFCLEVHGQKTNKRSILNSLMDSHERRQAATAPPNLQEQINRLEEHRNTLGDYTRKLNMPWQATGLTPHQILQRATDFGDRFSHPSGHNLVLVDDPADISDAFIARTLESAERLQDVFEAVARQMPDVAFSHHPWYGLCNGNLVGSHRQALIDALERWTERQEHIIERWSQWQDSLDIDAVDAPDQETLSTLVKELDALPENISNKLLARIDALQDNSDSLDMLLRQRERLRQSFIELSSSFNPDKLLSVERATATAESLLTIRDELGLAGSATLSTVKSHVEQLGNLRMHFSDLNADVRVLEGTLPAALNDILTPSLNGLESLAQVMGVVASLPAKLWPYRDDLYRDPEFKPALDDIEPLILSLREQYNQLENIFTIDHLPGSRILEDIDRALSNGDVFAYLKSDYRNASKALEILSRKSVKPAAARSALPELLRYQQGLEELAEKHSQHPALGSAFEWLDTNLTLHRTMTQWYQFASTQLSQHSLYLSPKADALFSLDDDTASLLVNVAATDLGERAHKLRPSFDKLQSLYPQYFSTFSGNSHIRDSAIGLTGLINRLDGCLARLEYCVLDTSEPLSAVIELANRWANVTRDHLEWTQSEAYSRFVPSLFPISANPQVDDSTPLSTLENARTLVNLMSSSSLFCKAMRKETSQAQLDRIRDAQPAMMAELNAASDAQGVFETLGHVERSQWQSGSREMAHSHAHNTKALRQADWLDTWLAYQRVKHRNAQDSLAAVMSKLEEGSLPADQVSLAIKADLYQQLAMHLLSADEALATMDGNEMSAIRQQFQRCDKELLALQRQQIAANCSHSTVPAGDGSGAADSDSELSFIEHEARKNKRQVAIRTLFKQAPRAIQALKPCFMMSPSAVARYLQPGQYDFDVVILDEASRIRPENAVGTIARGRQLVVVGDPRQLAPDMTASRHTSHDDQGDDENVGLACAQSILDAVLPVLPARHLRWHYRSRHESLIAFSNQKFYDSDLMLFPSPFNQSKEYGIQFTRIDDGTFNDQINMMESERVVALLAKQIQLRPQESIGIVAMTSKQRGLIEALWEKRLMSDMLVQYAYDINQKNNEPLFFKSLDHVQGDERDVIIVSMTYGPQMVGGITYQKFGPLNSDTGWRRLNVLLTRSRKRMDIIASMGSADVRADSSSKLGVQSLRALLAYCETGHLTSTPDAETRAENAFEMALVRKLAAAGYAAEAHVGVAGYFIDVGIRHPDRPGEFLMGIDCDGASYPSASSVRDRDRLRQDVLEALGWNIRRIWSMDWFRNADAQVNAIVAELERLQEACRKKDTDDFVLETNTAGVE